MWRALWILPYGIRAAGLFNLTWSLLESHFVLGWLQRLEEEQKRVKEYLDQSTGEKIT